MIVQVAAEVVATALGGEVQMLAIEPLRNEAVVIAIEVVLQTTIGLEVDTTTTVDVTNGNQEDANHLVVDGGIVLRLLQSRELVTSQLMCLKM